MTDNTQDHSQPQAQAQDERMFQLHRIYIKDLSLNPPSHHTSFSANGSRSMSSASTPRLTASMT